ncbi:hypothetical protein ACEQ8H_004664 [Pleosporales sp. CAS-2024a]
MPHQTNDGSPSPTTLPPNPFSEAVRLSPRPSAPGPVDLTSPTRPSRTPRTRDTSRGGGERLRKPKKTKSEDELRLIGDYYTPADSVAAPDPTSYFQSSSMAKPPSNNSFKPVNTLDDRPGTAKPKKYGKSSQRFRSIGHVPGNGELGYLKSLGNVETPTRASSSRGIRSTSQSPTKRRKITHEKPTEVIDLSEDDDMQEMSSHRTPRTPAMPSSLPRSAHSSRSRGSVAGGLTLSTTRSGVRSTNEFMFVEGQVKGRMAARKQQSPDVQLRGSYGRSVSGSVTPRLKDPAMSSIEDGILSGSTSTRRKILTSFRQGESGLASADGGVVINLQHDTTSRHFPNAQINESSMGGKLQTTNKRQASADQNELRKFRRTTDIGLTTDSVSDDELGMDPPQYQAAKGTNRRTESDVTRAAKSGAKRGPHKDAGGSSSWPLIWARSLKFDSHCITPSQERDEWLFIRSGDEPKTWRIVSYDDASGHFKTQDTITPQDVITVLADETGRVRLEGSRAQDGNRRIVDLEFRMTQDFREFCNRHVEELTGRSRVTLKSEEHMTTIFSKSLIRNDKIGTSPLISDATPTESHHEIADIRSQKRPLWSAMRPAIQEPTATSSADGGLARSSRHGTLPATTHSVRLVRSTRASGRSFDVKDDDHLNQAERYSVIHGLGTPWRESLTFGEGRQRATVNFTDLERLDEGEFLNDNLIDFYMIYCFKQSKVPDKKIYFFNTFFYSRLTENTGRASMNYKAVERWTSKVDIFNYDYVVVPINQDTHWFLAIICNVDKMKRKAIQEDFSDAPGEGLSSGNTVEAKAEGPVVPGAPTEQKAIDIADPPLPSSRAASVEQVDKDVNLFDEKSGLDLIDREGTGTEVEQLHSSAAQSPVLQTVQDDTTQKLPSIFDQVDVPKTVLSNLKTSQTKALKRRAMGPRRDPDQPVIIVMDSLGQTRGSAVRALKDWIAAEGREKRGMDAEIREKGVYPKSNQIPTQSNFSDCGLFLLGYAEKFFQDPDEFKRKLLLGEMTADADWPELKPAEMRNSLRTIILDLAKEQKLTESKKKRAKTMAATKADAEHSAKRLAETSAVPTPAVVEPVVTASARIQRDAGPGQDGYASALLHQFEDAGADEKGTSEAEATATATATASEPSSDRGCVPQLGSPFKPKQCAAQSLSSQELSNAKEKVLAADACVAAEEAMDTSAQSKISPVIRRRPEVRVRVVQGSRREQGSKAAWPRAAVACHQMSPRRRWNSPLKKSKQVEEGEEDEVDVMQSVGRRANKSPTGQTCTDEEQRRKTKSPNSGSRERPMEIDCGEETQAVAMDVDGQGNVSRHVDDDDDGDAEIQETPTPERSRAGVDDGACDRDAIVL